MIGPYHINRIVLCSADASPRSQRRNNDQAQYFFPEAKWVGTVRNAAMRLHCRFVILTTAHGMVSPEEEISPYDMHIREHKDQVRQNWSQTIPVLIGNNQYDILVFYAGGCPIDEMVKVMLPILQLNNIDLIAFGRPNMFDVNKIDNVIEFLIRGTSLNEIRSILRFPDRLLFYSNR